MRLGYPFQDPHRASDGVLTESCPTSQPIFFHEADDMTPLVHVDVWNELILPTTVPLTVCICPLVVGLCRDIVCDCMT